MKRDGKHLPMDNVVVAFFYFLGCVLVVIPLWLVVLLPLTLLHQGGVWLLGKLSGKKPKSNAVPAKASEVRDRSRVVPEKDRAFDLVVFGATGFTGKMAARYLAKTYGHGKAVRWAIAGRRRSALEEVRAELAIIDSACAQLPIVIADSSDLASIEAMVRSTKVVITTAGPFDKYGSDLVRICAETGTHYCDITGETDWVRKMIDLYDNVARTTGARIVHFCGHDCVPWDLCVLELSKKMQSKNDVLEQVSFFDYIRSDPSGGTLATIFHSLSARVLYKSTLGFDPLLKTLQCTRSDCKLSSKNQAFLGFANKIQSWVGPFVMAPVMANCVRRSNAVLGYNPSTLKYSEAQVYPNFMAGVIFLTYMIIFGTAILFPPLRWLVQGNLLPNPGEGPSESAMNDGFLKIVGFGRGANGTQSKVTLYFPTDPGYRDTARMLVESGLTLAFDLAKLPAHASGGVWTPATCQGEVLLQRLVNTGCSFHIE